MTWVTELISNIPDITKAIAPGFLLFAAFSWVTSKKYESGATVVVISAVLSYVIWEFGSLFVDSETTTYKIAICAISAVTGILAAIIFKAAWFNVLIGLVGIKRTTNNSVWDDVVGGSSWVAVFDLAANEYICGQFHLHSNEHDKAYLVLSTYYIADPDGKIKVGKDYVLDDKRKIMLDPDNYEKIIFSSKDPFNHYQL